MIPRILNQVDRVAEGPELIALGTAKGPMRLGPLARGRVGRLDDGAGGGAAGADDQAGALVGDLGRGEAGVGDRLLHGDVGIGRAGGEEPRGPPVDQRFPVDGRRGVDLAAEAQLGIVRRRDDAGARLPQRGGDLLGAIADRRDDAHAGDHHSAHEGSFPPFFVRQTRSAALNRPTLRSRAS